MEAVHHFFLLLVLTSSVWADDPIEVETTSSSSAMGPFGCPVAKSTTTRNVRLHSLKTSRGLVFYRRTISQPLFECVGKGGPQNLAATNIKGCAEATEAADLKTFSWEDNVCTGYSMSIPKAYTCRKNEAVVLYSVEDGVVNELHWMILYRSITSIIAEWGTCDPDSPSSVNKFELSWNGQTIPLSGTTYEYRLKDQAFCTQDFDAVLDDLKSVTLSAFDASNSPVMAPVTEIAQFEDHAGVDRWALSSGNCILFLPALACAGYDGIRGLCSYVAHADIFKAKTDADAITYKSDLTSLKAAISVLTLGDHFVGLMQDQPNSGNWTWLSGLSQSPTAAHFTEVDATQTCASSSSGSDFAFNLGVACDGQAFSCVCHEHLSP